MFLEFSDHLDRESSQMALTQDLEQSLLFQHKNFAVLCSFPIGECTILLSRQQIPLNCPPSTNENLNRRFHRLWINKVWWERDKYLPICNGSCRNEMSNRAATIWTTGLNAAVKTGPRFFTPHDIPTKQSPDPAIPCFHTNHQLYIQYFNISILCTY